MKLDLTTAIIGLEGKPVNGTKEVFVIRKNEKGEDEFEKDSSGKEIVLTIATPEQAFTIKKVLINSLLASSEEKISTEEKAKRFSLFFRIENAKTDKIEFTAEEVTLCKKVVQENCSILVAGRACRILENK